MFSTHPPIEKRVERLRKEHVLRQIEDLKTVNVIYGKLDKCRKHYRKNAGVPTGYYCLKSGCPNLIMRPLA